MANTIKLKSGSGNNPSASDLVVGEVALRTDGNPKLFTKNDAGNVVQIGLDIASSATFSEGIVLPTTAKGIKFGEGSAVNDDCHFEWLGGSNAGYLRISTGDDSDSDAHANEYIEFGDYAATNKGGSFTQHVRISRDRFLVRTGTASSVGDRLNIASDGTVDIYGNLDVGAGIDVTGNITVTGTVDGVDIATRDTLFGGLTSSSGVLTNGVTATTQSASDNSAKVATTAYTDTAISNLVDSSPSTLNTLNELAAALGDDANFSTTVTNSIATKLPLAGGTLTGNLAINRNQPIISFDDTSDNPDYYIGNIDGAFKIRDTSNAADRLVVNTDGHVDVTGNLDLGAGLDVTGTTNLSGALNLFNGDVTINSTLPIINLTDTDNNSDFSIRNNNGTFLIYDNSNTATRFSINSFGNITCTGDITVPTSMDSTDTGGVAIQRFWSTSITAGNIFKCGYWTDGEGAVQLLITVRSITSANSGTSTYIFQGGFRALDATGNGDGDFHRRLMPLASGAGHGNGADKGLDSSGGWEVWINQRTGYQYDVVIHVPTGRANKSLQISVTELNRGNNFVDLSTSAAYSSITTNSTPILPSGYSYLGTTNLTGNLTISNTLPSLFLTDTNNNDDYSIQNQNGYFAIKDESDGFNRLVIHPDGTAVINGNLDVGSGLDITGNITVSGTVDGRDLAADGSKLDTYEANGSSYLRSDAADTASGALTFSRELTFSSDDDGIFLFGGGRFYKKSGTGVMVRLHDAGTPLQVENNSGTVLGSFWHSGNDGAGTGLDADTLDGIQASSFLRSDAADTASGDITFNGGAGAITVAAGGDIRIANSGGWTGEHGGKLQHYLNFLYIQGGTSGIRLRHSDGNDRWVIDSNGHFVAGADSTYDIGSSSVRVRNGYFDTLYGDGSNLTGLTVNNANTLDNLDSTQFVRSDADDTLNGQYIINDSADEKLVLQGSTNPILRFKEGTTNKAWLQWHGTNGYVVLGNSEDNTGIRLDDQLRVTRDGFTTNHQVWDAGNDGSGSGLDADSLDGIGSGGFLRSNVSDNVGGTLTFISGSGLNLCANDIYLRARVINNNNTSGSNDGLYIGYGNGSSGATRIYGGGTTNGGLVISGNGASDINFNSQKVFYSGNDGSGSGLDADTLDGVQGSSFLRSDANDTASGQITLTSTALYPLNINSSNNGKIVLQGSSDPFIRFREGTTDKAYIQWVNSGIFQFVNQESGEYLRIKSGSNGLTFTVDNSEKTVWHSGNDGSGSGLDADTLDGFQGSSYLRSDTNDTMSGNLTVTGTGNFSGKVDFQGDAAIEGGSGYGVFKGYTSNDNHFITSRGIVANQSTLSITGGHQMTFVEHASTTSEGWYFKSKASGSYAEKARIDGTSQMYLGGHKVFHYGNDGSGSLIDSDTVDGIEASSFLRADADDSFSGKLSNTSRNEVPSSLAGAIHLQPSTSGGNTGIFFNSRVNANSDAAYIWWYDDNNNYRINDSSENGALVIGIQNDGNATSEDAIAIESSGNIFLNPGNDGGLGNAGGVTGADFAEGKVYIGRAATKYEVFHAGAHALPDADNTYDLGSSAKRFRFIYTTDIQLSNENTGGNEVDGTEGTWTLQEGEDDIYMINRKNGKRYKIKMEEV